MPHIYVTGLGYMCGIFMAELTSACLSFLFCTRDMISTSRGLVKDLASVLCFCKVASGPISQIHLPFWEHLKFPFWTLWTDPKGWLGYLPFHCESPLVSSSHHLHSKSKWKLVMNHLTVKGSGSLLEGCCFSPPPSFFLSLFFLASNGLAAAAWDK